MRMGFGEIVVILALALLFFGPSKLPKLGQSLGEAIRGLKKGLAGLDETGEPVDKPAVEQAAAQQLPAVQVQVTPVAPASSATSPYSPRGTSQS
jgi:sec-independent protein translocase protein TatA